MYPNIIFIIFTFFWGEISEYYIKIYKSSLLLLKAIVKDDFSSTTHTHTNIDMVMFVYP